MGSRRVAQHADAGRGKKLVTQGDYVVHDGCKFRVGRRLSVAGKRQDVGSRALAAHLFQSPGESIAHLAARGARQGGATVGVEATLAIDAVEGADFPIAWHQVDAQRDTQPAAVDRPEDGRGVYNGRHGNYVVCEFCCLQSYKIRALPDHMRLARKQNREKRKPEQERKP